MQSFNGDMGAKQIGKKNKTLITNSIFNLYRIMKGITMTSLATKTVQTQSAKQWLYSVRAIERRKRTLMHEIADLKADRETIFDIGTTFYGSLRVQNGREMEPTQHKAIVLCEKLSARLDKLLSELEHLTLETDAVRSELNDCFEQSDMTVQEFESLFYFFFEGMSNEEVAEAMFYSLNMVFKLKVLALRKLSEWRARA